MDGPKVFFRSHNGTAVNRFNAGRLRFLAVPQSTQRAQRALVRPGSALSLRAAAHPPRAARATLAASASAPSLAAAPSPYRIALLPRVHRDGAGHCGVAVSASLRLHEAAPLSGGAL